MKRTRPLTINDLRDNDLPTRNVSEAVGVSSYQTCEAFLDGRWVSLIFQSYPDRAETFDEELVTISVSIQIGDQE